jgi:hypothetical protein
MDHEQFKSLLTVAKEFKLESFELGELKVNFHPINFMAEAPKQEPTHMIDEDELMLKHIEKLKDKAMKGIKAS